MPFSAGVCPDLHLGFHSSANQQTLGSPRILGFIVRVDLARTCTPMHPSEHCGAWPSLTTSSQLSVSASSFLHECRHAAALAMLLNRNRPSDLGEQVDCRCGHLSHAGNRCAHALVSLSFSECFSGNVELLSIFRNFI